LTAAALAVQTFVKDSPSTLRNIHLRMDNTSALRYVSGGDPFSESDEGGMHNLGLVPTTRNHPVGIALDNTIADQESREMQTPAEWKLHRELFL